ncbi:ricin-type beta-trefoil lectin domain protein [Actinoplanes palleronii]|uniref:Ricin B lectin domain-containing protein n=1 Tax=Actinoplanes palleronii TaxID=113570 RepID=A0ABQ4B2M8_9ACTN|nr:RICIN domain-containing protein [Actinoplanes palleronii]GIE64510.1 hypothetical protein Apa02nite_006180 [Actinoplanes palleronii]
MKVRSRAGAVAVVVAAAVALTAGVSLPASAAVAGPVAGLAGKCLDVAAGGTANGTKIQLYDCNGTAAQQWNVADDGTIRALGKCLDVSGGVNANGTKVQLWDCLGNGHQQWRYDTTTKGLMNPETGRCLDAAGQSSANGTQIQVWACNSQTNQDWVLPGGTPGGCTRSVGAGEHQIPVTLAGRQYQVTVYVPAGTSPATRLPMVLDLHGTQMTGSQQLQYSVIKPAADAGKFLVVAPTGDIPAASGFAWNVPGVGTVPAGARDDVAFLDQVITTATAVLCADPSRVYGTGYSGGGRMMSAFACQRADRVAAIAPVAGLRAGRPDPQDTSRPDPQSCAPVRPMPVIAFHGEQDATNPYQGGGTELWRYSVPVAQRRWAQINGCTTGPTVTAISAHVVKTVYSGCTAGADVVLYAVANGGHTWPDTSVDNGNGTVTHEISADTLMWEFFQRFRLPTA